MTWPPAASMRAAAAITSITMKGGTSLRPDAVSRVFARSLSVDSSIAICYLTGCRRIRVPAPVTAPDWPYSVAPYSVFTRSGYPVGVKKTRQNKRLTFGSDLIRAGQPSGQAPSPIAKRRLHVAPHRLTQNHAETDCPHHG